jgi:hypothetical protein
LFRFVCGRSQSHINAREAQLACERFAVLAPRRKNENGAWMLRQQRFPSTAERAS